MNKKYIFWLILFFNCFIIYATIQRNDYLIYNGVKYYIDENPMEEYFLSYPSKRPKTNTISSDLWRGYIATFEIINNELWVTKIEIITRTNRNTGDHILRNVINRIFNGKNKIKVEWYSGLLGLSKSRYSNLNENYNIREPLKTKIFLP